MGGINPLIFIYLAFRLEDLCNLVVGLNVQSRQHFEPFSNQLIVFLGRDEVALVGKVPHALCVVSFVDFPVKR